MLYNKDWDKKTAPPVYSLHGIISWLETQPRDVTYDWCDAEGCLCHKYLVAMGERKRSFLAGGYINRLGYTLGCVFETLMDYRTVAATQPWTFGDAMDRAIKLREKSNG